VPALAGVPVGDPVTRATLVGFVGIWPTNPTIVRPTSANAQGHSLPSMMQFQAGATSVVQNAHRDAATGIALRHSGQSRVVDSTSGPVRRRSIR
jgi:hypothetical protein